MDRRNAFSVFVDAYHTVVCRIYFCNCWIDMLSNGLSASVEWCIGTVSWHIGWTRLLAL